MSRSHVAIISLLGSRGCPAIINLWLDVMKGERFVVDDLSGCEKDSRFL